MTFKIYQDSDAAYNDVLANNLDVTDEIPASALIDDKYKSDLPDRNAQKATGAIQNVAFAPATVDPLYADPKLRQAISMAIDRETIIKQIFNGTREPATGWVSPVVDGYKADQCGEFCKFDPAKAKALYEEAGGFKGDKMTLSYNADAAHKDWTEATCNSIKQTLGVECQAVGVVDFATFRQQVGDRKMKGMFRNGWVMDYPSIENFMTPLYGTKAAVERHRLLQPGVRQAPRRGCCGDGPGAGQRQVPGGRGAAQGRHADHPLWYGKDTFGWSENVTGVKITPFGQIDWASISRK